MNISQEKFESFVKIQMAGVTNMFDTEKVCKYTGLDKEEVKFIINNYSTLYNQYIEE